MAKFNLKPISIEKSYLQGMLPQRNNKNVFYFDSSCRSNLSNFKISSENRRILKKTEIFTYQIIPIDQFEYNLSIQKNIYNWIKQLGWEFPISSVKNIFKNHIFNYVYVWKINDLVCAYSLCYFSNSISHIAYVFYDPQYANLNLPIRLSLQVIIDSYEKKLDYCYLGRFDPKTKLGFYKRNFPGFEYFYQNKWLKFI